MNETNPLENQLRCWIPRRPSASLKASVFGQSAQAGGPADVSAGRTAVTSTSPDRTEVSLWHRLAPALALLILSLVFLGRNPEDLTRFSASPSPRLIATVALSHPQLVGSFGGRNVWPTATFDWTNGGHSLTTSPPFIDVPRARP